MITTGLSWCFRTSHGPVGLAHILLSEDETDEADASVHQPHQETRHGEDFIAGRKGGQVTEEHLKKQTWRNKKKKKERDRDENDEERRRSRILPERLKGFQLVSPVGSAD